jgi:hypothetical protein
MSQMQLDLIVKMNFTAWEMQNKRLAELVEKLTEQQILNETAPRRNTGAYLLGHITAVSDDMLKLLGIREKMFPEYYEIFIKSPVKSGKIFPSIAELKSAYKSVTNELNSHFSKFSSSDWLAKHTAVSDEDFAKEPHRNKLNVLINRTSHLSNHLGQMAYLNK